MEITYPTKLSTATSPISNCLSPSSSLACQFSQSIAFSPTSSTLDDCNSRLSHSIFVPTQTTSTVPLITHSPATNLIFNLAPTSNHYSFFNSQQQQQQQQHDQKPIVDTSTKTSSTNTTTTHVLCR